MPQTLYIIDGYAQVFRAFFAIRNGMRSPATGEPTHAVFGITGMLIKLLSQYRPDYVVVAWDEPGQTFRDELFADYKATRSPTPEDLKAQVPRIRELFDAFGIPVLGRSGLEADDIIACIVSQVRGDPALGDVFIRIVSKDKDLEQLLDERVSMFDVQTDLETGVADLLTNKGITPQQVIDVLALTGDSVDNVPGVAGIGPKTAIQLIQQFGSVDGILARLGEIKGKVRERLEESRDNLLLSRALVTLHCDTSVGFTLETARVTEPAIAKLIPLFQQLGFNRFQDEVRRLGESHSSRNSGPAPVDPATGTDEPPESLGRDEILSLWDVPAAEAPAPATLAADYRIIRSPGQLADYLLTLEGRPLVALDIETTGLGRTCLLVGVSLSAAPHTGVYIPVRSPEPESHMDDRQAIALLKPLLESETVKKCGHNLKFDSLVLRRYGVTVRGIAFDSMLAGGLLAPAESQKLDDLALARLGHANTALSSLIGAGKEQLPIEDVALEEMADYAAEDADIALQLALAMQPDLEKAGMTRLMAEVEAPLVEVLTEMETNGIRCDPDELSRQGALLATRVEELKIAIFEAAECQFDLNSTKQMATILFEKLGLPSGRKTKTGYSTDFEVLEKLAAQEDRDRPYTTVPRLILEYRQLNKLITTYLGNLRDAIDPATGRIYTTFLQLAAATGRLASNNPNLQNIPIRTDIGRQIRRAFLAPEGGLLICADYSQIELRLIAHLSGDPALLQAFESGEDVHVAVAAHVFSAAPEDVTREQRSQAKTINYAIVYGVTPFGLARRIEGLDVAAATELIARYRQQFSGVATFLQECIEQARSKGYVSTLLGRRRSIPEIESHMPNLRSLGERLAINSVVQGSAADLIKIAMVNVYKRIDRQRLPMRLLLQIHDELVLESPAEHAEEMSLLVCEEMERAMTLRIPLMAESGVGQNWMEAK